MLNFFHRHKKKEASAETYLIVGLGNPGREYENSRHNIGFMVINRLADRYGIKTRKYQSRAMTGSGNVSGKRIILAKPQTYMNNSGAAVRELSRYYKIESSRLFIIHDDVDLDLGILRLRASGSSGGHRGMDSIIRELGTTSFPRMRIGIGRPPGRMDTAHYVLEGFLPSELELLEVVLDRAVQAEMTFLEAGIEQAMSKFNGNSMD
jgi:PTH1 family peptidyl-tRNA hydrolase